MVAEQAFFGNSNFAPRLHNVAGATWQVMVNNNRIVATNFKHVPVFAPLHENMTSSTKPEVRNVLYCRQRRTEPRPQVTGTENFGKFGRVRFEM